MTSRFGLDVRKWVDSAKQSIDKDVRAIEIALFSAIIKSTPVDPGGGISEHVGGRARGNWQVSVGRPTTEAIDRADTTGAQTIADVIAGVGGAGKITWLSNNLPYIGVLEYGGYPNPPKLGTRLKGGGYEIRSVGGYSRQAAAGMVRINVARFDQIVNEAVSEETTA